LPEIMGVGRNNQSRGKPAVRLVMDQGAGYQIKIASCGTFRPVSSCFMVDPVIGENQVQDLYGFPI